MTWILGVLLAIAAAMAAMFARRWNDAQRLIERQERNSRAALESTRDTTHRMESAAARITLEYEELLAASDDAVLVLDHSHKILRANRSAHRVFGESDRELIGRTLLQATISSELSNLVSSAMSTESIRRREVRLPGSTGQVLIVSAARIDISPEPVCMLVARDITELRRLESVRRDFVGNVSHELRTPLASIRAMAETLLDGALNDPEVSGKFLETIVSESDRLTRIAQDLLVLSAAESGPPESDQVDVSVILGHVLEHSSDQAARAGISLEGDVTTGLIASGSADQLQQVFLNLLENAIKYTRPPGSIYVSALREDSHIIVRVADTGIGILSEHLPRIFERFYRVDKGRSRASGGTGLGLAIVKHIVESHGGQVRVESEYNRGSTFTVSLPAVDQSDQMPLNQR